MVKDQKTTWRSMSSVWHQLSTKKNNIENNTWWQVGIHLLNSGKGRMSSLTISFSIVVKESGLKPYCLERETWLFAKKIPRNWYNNKKGKKNTSVADILVPLLLLWLNSTDKANFKGERFYFTWNSSYAPSSMDCQGKSFTFSTFKQFRALLMKRLFNFSLDLHT